MMNKSMVDEIRARFDSDIERFSDMQSGQAATIDSLLHMQLLPQAAASVTPHARTVLDIGCGTGNYSLKLPRHLPHVQVTLIDLSRPMLDRAIERISKVSDQPIHPMQGNVLELNLGE